ncbi:MAG: AI-2E family transporter [Deltaproteobacteria bacterium]|nr:AI-2E family transporter [Deltaproteobacteria bacterium]
MPDQPPAPPHLPTDSSSELQPLPKGLASFGPSVSPGAHRALVVLVLAAASLALYVVWPFRTPLFMAVVMAAVLHPLHRKLEARLKGRAALSAALVTLALFLALAVPVASVMTFIAQEVSVGVAWVRSSLGVSSVSDLDWTKLPPPAMAFVEKVLATLHISPETLKDYLDEGLDRAQALSKEVLGASAGFAAGTLIMLAALYVMLIDGKGAVRYLKAISPLPRAQTNELFTEFANVTGAAVLGSTVTAFVQGTLATIGYFVAGVPHAFFLGVATLVCSFIPAVGTLLVWVPACAVLVVNGRTKSAIVLALYCLVVVGASDNVVKPLVMRGKVAMHGGLVLLSLLGGVTTFGLLGLILGPLALSFFVALLRIYRRDYLEQA